MTFGEIVSGDVQLVRNVIVASGKNHLLRGILARAAVHVRGVRDERAIGAGDVIDALVLPDVEPVVIRHAPVIFESLGAHRFFVERGHRDVADFEQLGVVKKTRLVG